MIENLHVTAFFSESGATLSGDFQPQPGITAVVGENGVGKTFLTVEATRWLLFGKAALRGAAADYRQSEARGTFVIRGARYEISRGKQEWVKDASGAVVAKGAEKVTEYVVGVLGYGLDVFDLCNAATQGNVQRLGDMRAGERKAIIDKVLRLTDAEKAEKDCRTEALGYRREAEALTRALRAPGDEPVKPPHLPAATLRASLTQARQQRDALSALRGRLRTLEAPQRPQGDRPRSVEIADLEAIVDEQRDLHRRHRDLTVAAGAYGGSEAQLEAAEKRAAARRARDARGEVPTLTREEVDRGFEQHRAALAHKASEPVTCPECGHSFRPTGDAPPDPTWPRVRLDVEDARLRAWVGADPTKPLPPGTDMSEAELLNARRSLAARMELGRLPPLAADRQGELANLRRLFHHWETYDEAVAAHAAAVASNADVEAEIAALGEVPDQGKIDMVADDLRAMEVWEAAHTAWRAEDAAFKAAQEKITEASRLADEFKAGAEGIADARAVVKALIAPKISRIATALIRDMSLNKLTSLTVDDDMEITVGTQRIETLSGAGKTVANLALRVAMGQALVGHVFPVFLADEIDGDMTASRREATLQSLVGLKKHMQQIILVTHRGADIADHVFEVTG